MASSKSIRSVGYFDCDNGGQVVVDGDYAYIAPLTDPCVTTIVDVSDPINL